MRALPGGDPLAHPAKPACCDSAMGRSGALRSHVKHDRCARFGPVDLQRQATERVIHAVELLDGKLRVLKFVSSKSQGRAGPLSPVFVHLLSPPTRKSPSSAPRFRRTSSEWQRPGQSAPPLPQSSPLISIAASTRDEVWIPRKEGQDIAPNPLAIRIIGECDRGHSPPPSCTAKSGKHSFPVSGGSYGDCDSD